MADRFVSELERLSFAHSGNFSSLLPFGVLTLSSFRGLPAPPPIAPDGWHWAPPLPWLSSKRGTLERDLEFLSHHDFIRGTYRMTENGIAVVRIYVMPEDCEWYLIREPAIEFRGRALLDRLWDLVDVTPSAWENGIANEVPLLPSLLADDDVSLNLSAIFNSLPSPQPDPMLTEKAPRVVREVLDSALDDDGVPGFKSQLYHYQKESVWKMLQRELLPQKQPDPRLRKWIGPTGILSRINVGDMTFFHNERHVDDVRGGILCEEMGTGKTVHPF
jgi:hypothetical protein